MTYALQIKHSTEINVPNKSRKKDSDNRRQDSSTQPNSKQNPYEDID
jgi:hypothetical protein